MNRLGLVNVAIAQINSTVGDLAGNSQRIAHAARQAAVLGAHIVLTPELSLVGYPPEDLLLRHSFYAKSELALQELAKELADLNDLHVIVGHPLQQGQAHYNAASILCNGQILKTYRKHALPNYTVFDEKRYFVAADDVCTFELNGICFAITICEDTWYPEMPARARAAGEDRGHRIAPPRARVCRVRAPKGAAASCERSLGPAHPQSHPRRLRWRLWPWRSRQRRGPRPRRPWSRTRMRR